MVITGLGVMTPIGVRTEEYWQSVLDGKSGIGPITRFDATGYPVTLAGEVDFQAGELVPGRLITQTDRWTQLALAGADEALVDAEVDLAGLPEYEMAVVTSSSSGGTEFGQHEMELLYQKGPGWVGAYQSIAWFYAATTGQLSIRHGMRGPCGVMCTEQAGGLDALGQTRRVLRSDARLVVTGGTDASLCPYGLVAQLSSGRLSPADDPARAYLPFDLEAAGYVPGEGGAILIAERADAAAQRGAGEGYGKVVGYAAGFDPASGTGRPRALPTVIRRALDDARVDAGDIDVVFADAAADPVEDAAEAAALSAVFGARGVPVAAPKTLTGRLYAGGAAVDVATALLSMRDSVIPHCVGPTRIDPDHDIDLVIGQPREVPVRTALVLARGFGGFTAAVVLQRSGLPGRR